MRGQKLKRDIFLNTFFSFFIALSIIWVTRQAGKIFAPSTLGIFLLSRQLAETIANILQLGTSQTLRRYLPMSEDSSTKMIYIIAVLSIFIVATLVFILVAVLGLDYWTSILFSDNSASKMVLFWICILAIAIVANFLAAAILLSYGRITAYNLLRISSNIWILVGLWIWQKGSTIERLFSLQGACMMIISASIIIYTLIRLSPKLRHISSSTLWQKYKLSIRETIGYGLPHGVIPFLETALLLVGPFLIRDKVAESGYLIISFKLMRIGRMLAQPAARIIGVTVAKLVGQQKSVTLKKAISLLFGMLIHINLILLAVSIPWIGLILHIWLGNPTLANNVYQYAFVLMFAMPFFTIFQGLKEPIEMIWKRPFNLYTLSGGTSLLVIWFYVSNIFLPSHISILYGYLFTYIVIGILTVIWIRKYLNHLKYFGLGKLFLVSAVVCLLNWLTSQWLSLNSIWLDTVIFLSIIGVSTISAIIFLCFYRPNLFILEARQFLLPELRRLGFGK